MTIQPGSYIFQYNKAENTYSLFSTKHEMHIDASHPKFEWLSDQEAGRIVKINEKGRWNSSKDYEGLYDSIKPRKIKAAKATSKKNAPKKKVIEKNSAKNTNKNTSKKDATPINLPTASNYGFFFNEKAGNFLLRDAEGNEAHIEATHPKFEWLCGQEAGRVIKINEKGRWNSSKDYKGLYELLGEVSFDKKKAAKKTKRAITKEAKTTTKKTTNDKGQSEALQQVKKELDALKKSYARLLKEKEDTKELLELVEAEMLYAPRDIYMLNGIMAQSDDKHAALKAKADELGVTLFIKENAYWDGKDLIHFWGFKSKVLQLAEALGYAKDVDTEESAKYQLQHIKASYIEELKSKIRSLNSENAYLKEDLKEARKTVVVKKANKPPKVVRKVKWEAKIVADLTYVSIYSLDKKKTKEPITIRIVTNELESKPSQSLFKSFIKLGLQKRIIDNPKYIDHRIYSVSGFPDGIYKQDRKITNIIFSFIKEY